VNSEVGGWRGIAKGRLFFCKERSFGVPKRLDELEKSGGTKSATGNRKR